MFSISSYFSLNYILLLLSTVILYACLPRRPRRIVLLAASLLFFYAVSGKLVCYLLFSTLSIHHIGLWLSVVQKECDEQLVCADRQQGKEIKTRYQKKQRAIVVFAVILHVGILVLLKYTPFITSNINSLLHLMGITFTINAPAFLIPIGISFYTLQSVSYISDVYRRKIPADKNLMRLALFMSFFPQIMEGPICRYSDTAGSLWAADKISQNNLSAGFLRILFGIMKKLVLADRLNLLISNVFSDYGSYDGFVIAVGTICYTLQLYMDFSGTMDMVIGSAQIFGVKLPENFRRPFFSATISEFWKRWHITLGAWFRDYIFYPVSTSKSMKTLTSRARKKLGNHFGPLIAGSISLFCVWICNGLWHGAGWQFIFFGMYHFVLILAGSMMEPAVVSFTRKHHIDRSCRAYRCMQIIRTCILVCIGELFFRATDLETGFKMLKKIFTDFSFSTVRDGSFFTFGMDRHEFLIAAVAVSIIIIVGVKQEKGIRIGESLAARNTAVRFAVYMALIIFTAVFGAYGAGYVPVDPIYAGF